MVDTHFFHEAHFTGFSFQSNVYGLTHIPNADGVERVLVAPLHGKVHSIEFHKASEELQPVSREIDFLFIPEDAEFISIHSIYKAVDEEIIIALSFIKDCETEKPSYSINIYYPWEHGSQFNLESISKNFCTIELDHVPYFLSHGNFLTKEGELDTVFLLSCGDKQIHIFREDEESTVNRWAKQSDQDGFPEFHDLPSVVLWFDMKILTGSRRLTVMGCQNGYLRICLVSMESKDILMEKEYSHDSAITNVQLFTSQHSDDREDKEYHLLVTSALEVSVVYHDVLSQGFSEQIILCDSDNYDATLCACVADIDWDGNNEILIGTYGQELIAYKYKNKQISEKQIINDLESIKDIERMVVHEYECMWKRSFAHPLLAVNYLDLTGDGLQEIVALSTKGVHILQHNLDAAAKMLMQKMTTKVESDGKKET